MASDKYHQEIYIGRRIKEIRKINGLTQKEFSLALGIVQGYLSGIEQGKKPPHITLLFAICHKFGVNEKWLFSGEGSPLSASNKSPGLPSAKIPLLDRIPPGFPDSVKPEDIADYVCLPKIREGCFAIIADGDFMAPTIRAGDLVIFTPGEEAENRSIVLLTNRWGEMILRRCRIKEGEIFFSPENAIYTPFKPDSDTRIYGTVVEIWRNVTS